MKNVSKRINVIVSQIPKCKVLCDVGCDHGYVPFLALEKGICEHVILVDVSKPSLKKAEDLFLQNNLKSQFVSYVSDGLVDVDKQFDALSICGMGGCEIIKILKQDKFIKNMPKNVILQPMKDEVILRTFLIESGYSIEKDIIFFDEDKFYVLIVAKLSDKKQNLSFAALEFGKTNLEDMSKDFIEYLKFIRRLNLEVLKNDLPSDKRELINKKLNEIERILNG